jgi:hypothetical protein
MRCPGHLPCAAASPCPTGSRRPLPQRLLDGTAEKSLLSPKTLGHRTLDDVVNSVWHQQQLARMGRGRVVRPNRGPATAHAIALLTTARDLLLPQLAPC